MSMSTLTIASVPRSVDVAQMNQNDFNRVMANQTVAQNTVEKNANAKRENVIKKDDVELGQQKFDAKEKGSNEYTYESKKREKEEKKHDGKVLIKGQSSFDMKV